MHRRLMAVSVVVLLLVGGVLVWRLGKYSDQVAECIVDFGGHPRGHFESLVLRESHAGFKAFASTLEKLGGYQPDVPKLLADWAVPGQTLNPASLRRIFGGNPTRVPLRHFRGAGEALQSHLQTEMGTAPGSTQEPALRLLVCLIVGLEHSDRTLVNLLLAASLRAKVAEVVGDMVSQKRLRDKDRRLFLQLWDEAAVERPTLEQVWQSEEKEFALLVGQVQKKATLASAWHRVFSGNPARQYQGLLGRAQTISLDELKRELAQAHPLVTAAFPNVVKVRDELAGCRQREDVAIAALRKAGP